MIVEKNSNSTNLGRGWQGETSSTSMSRKGWWSGTKRSSWPIREPSLMVLTWPMCSSTIVWLIAADFESNLLMARRCEAAKRPFRLIRDHLLLYATSLDQRWSLLVAAEQWRQYFYFVFQSFWDLSSLQWISKLSDSLYSFRLIPYSLALFGLFRVSQNILISTLNTTLRKYRFWLRRSRILSWRTTRHSFWRFEWSLSRECCGNSLEYGKLIEKTKNTILIWKTPS